MKKKFILSLGSGGLRGFVHLGVYKALYENNISIDAIYGTSVGSLIGAFISESWHPSRLIELALNLSPLELIDLSIPNNGYIAGKKLNAFIRKHIKVEKIEDLPIPLTLVATRTKSGAAEYFKSGRLADCIQASCAIPNVFKPVVINGIEYLDGDLRSPVPIKKAREEFRDRAVILAINIIPNASLASRGSAQWARFISKTIYRQALVENEKTDADFYLNPTVGYGVSLRKKECIKRVSIGYQETLAIIPQIKQILSVV